MTGSRLNARTIMACELADAAVVTARARADAETVEFPDAASLERFRARLTAAHSELLAAESMLHDLIFQVQP